MFFSGGETRKKTHEDDHPMGNPSAKSQEISVFTPNLIWLVERKKKENTWYQQNIISKRISKSFKNINKTPLDCCWSLSVAKSYRNLIFDMLKRASDKSATCLRPGEFPSWTSLAGHYGIHACRSTYIAAICCKAVAHIENKSTIWV